MKILYIHKTNNRNSDVLSVSCLRVFRISNLIYKKKDSNMTESQIGITADHTTHSNVFYFLSGVYSDAIATHFFKQLLTYITHIAITKKVNFVTKLCKRVQFLPTLTH